MSEPVDPERVFTRVREKGHAVLTCVRDGANTTRAIREETTLSNREVNYALDKLEDLGLIETSNQEGRVTEVIDGQTRNFKAPRRAVLTEDALAYFNWTNRQQTRYSALTHDELVERVQHMEQDIEALQTAFEAFRQQVMRKLK